MSTYSIKPVPVKKFIEYVELNGYVMVKCSGSHRIYLKPGESQWLTIPCHGNPGKSSPLIYVPVIKSNLQSMGKTIKEWLEYVDNGKKAKKVLKKQLQRPS